MDDNPKQQLKEKIKHCQKTVSSLLQEYGSLLLKQKSTDPTGYSDHSVLTPLVNDANKQLMDIELGLEEIRQQVQLAIEKYDNIQPALPTCEASSMIQSDDNQLKVANVLIAKQVNLFNDNNVQIKAKQDPIVQALFNGTLPDDFYLHLMSVMGIQECLLSNRLVCSFWNELVLERCHNQKSLKLFETFYNLMDYGEWLLKYDKTDDNSLILKSIGDDLLFEGLEIDHDQLSSSVYEADDEKEWEKKWGKCKILTSLFPAVERLVICPEFPTLMDFEYLLQFYAKQLTSLTMVIHSTWNGCPGSKLGAFKFPNLKSLHTLNFSPGEDQLLSLLPQLESLTLLRSKLGSESSLAISLETLLRTGTQLDELNLCDIKFVYANSEEEFSKRPSIKSHLRKFSFHPNRNVVETLEFISLNLPFLECLQIYYDCDQYTFPLSWHNMRHLHSLTSYLTSLYQLHSLTLQTPVAFFLLDDSQFAEIQPLPSVRRLKLFLSKYDGLSIEMAMAMDLFSRALFAAFPNVEQVHIGFNGKYGRNGGVDTAIAAFEDFAREHPNIVQLIRSKKMSKFTNLPNAVSPLLGHHRQRYEEYIAEDELFGLRMVHLTESLVQQEGKVRPNLKIFLRPADKLAAMNNLLRLLKSGAFAFTFKKAHTMIWHMSNCALKYGPSQVALFAVTVKCVLFLLDCSVVKETNVDSNNSDDSDESFDDDYDGTHLLDTGELPVDPSFDMMLDLVEHYRSQQLDDKNVLLQMYKRIVLFLEEFDLYNTNSIQFNKYALFKRLLMLADHYETEKLSVLDKNKSLLLKIRNFMDEQLKKFESDRLDKEISESIRSENRVYRIEMALALLRACQSEDNYFK